MGCWEGEGAWSEVCRVAVGVAVAVAGDGTLALAEVELEAGASITVQSVLPTLPTLPVTVGYIDQQHPIESQCS